MEIAILMVHISKIQLLLQIFFLAILIGTSLQVLQCVLPNSTLSGGEWSRSNGGPVDCTSNTNSDPLCCITTNTPATLSLYKPYGQVFLSSEDQLYKCCLPTNCSNPTYIITAYIFSKLSHCTITYCHLL